MNEPSVNLRLLQLFEDKINAEFPQLNASRICNLHVVHNAFKIRGNPSNFDLEMIMNGLNHKFYDTSIF